MKKTIAALSLVVGMAGLSACSSTTDNPGPPVIAQTVLPTSEPGIATGPMGSTFTLWPTSNTPQHFTLSNLHNYGSGVWQVNEEFVQLQGQGTPGYLSALTDQGARIDQSDEADSRGSFEWGGVAVQGEKRSGTVNFNIASDQKIVKVYYMANQADPAAVWTS